LAPGVAPDSSADQLLRRAVLVDVGRVPERDAQLNGLHEERLGRLVVQCPLVRAGHRGVAVAHAPEGEPADPEPGRPEPYVLHVDLLRRQSEQTDTTAFPTYVGGRAHRGISPTPLRAADGRSVLRVDKPSRDPIRRRGRHFRTSSTLRDI